MPGIPRERVPESTAALLRDPYGFIAERCRRYRSRMFEARLLLQRTVCTTGPRAAESFYDPSRFSRSGAAPGRLLKTLFGEGGVQGLDGRAHRHRKAMLLSLTAAERVDDLSALLAAHLRDRTADWAAAGPVVLYDEFRELLTRAVCAWSGVPLAESDVRRRTGELTAMYQYAGAVGPRHRLARRARASGERWIAELVADVRAGRLDPPPDSALRAVASHRDEDGVRLSPRTAAVELLNVLRPTVAVAVYLTFVAQALHEHPAWRRRLETAEARDVAGDTEHFVQEVRRFYPFFPFVAALSRGTRDVLGHRIPRGRRVLLDLYGTNHDPEVWQAPEKFRPERFRDGRPSRYAFVPQGGGDAEVTHRCPGEPVAVALMKVAVDFLVRRVDYAVPPQDLRIDTARLPALTRSGFVVTDVVRRT